MILTSPEASRPNQHHKTCDSRLPEPRLRVQLAKLRDLMFGWHEATWHTLATLMIDVPMPMNCRLSQWALAVAI